MAPPEWAYIINDAGAVQLIAESEFSSTIDKIRDDLPAVTRYVSIGKQDSERWIDFEGWWGDYSAKAPEIEIDADDVLYQMYTSGTTGRPKGAMLTQRCVIENGLQTTPYFKDVVGPGKRSLIVMPMFHAGATSFVFGTLIGGASMVIHRDFSPAAVAKALSEGEISVANLVPAMIQAMLEYVPDLADSSYEMLDVMIYGASSIAEDTLRRAMKVFQCDFYQGFGQTETSACVTMLSAADHRRALAGRPELLLSAGRALLGTTIRIVDDDGNEVPRGSSGEIVARGPQLMKGYWNLPEATAKTLVDGWIHTGDVGVMDDEGYVYIKDRIKDMVVSGGENVYPREIENVLFDHPAVADAAVIGVPDEKFGEAVLAVLVLRAGESVEPDTLIAFCREKLAGYKVPRRIEFVDELPRNASGKVLKKDLRKPYWEGRTRNVG